jgi:hypothetical protein
MKLFIIFFISIILLFVVGTLSHERQHKQIYEDYGIESKMHIDWRGFYVSPVNQTLANERCPMICQLSQEINDSVGYNVEALTGIVAVGFSFIIAMMELKWLDN